jgi:protein FRA10AC1
VAREYYHTQLYKEFALCDLSDAAAGRIALRWRTASEVTSGLGELTCSNIRCSAHKLGLYGVSSDSGSGSGFAKDSGGSASASASASGSSSSGGHEQQQGARQQRRKATSATLSVYEVPFQYTEHGRSLLELVKVTVCESCARQLFRYQLEMAVQRDMQGPDVESLLV